MRHKLALAAFACLVVVSVVEAEEVKGIVRQVDAPNRRLTVVGNNAKTISVAKDASVISQQQDDTKQEAAIRPVAAGLGGQRVGDQVTLLTEEQEGGAVVTSIKLAPQANKDSPKADNKPEAAKKKAKKNKTAKKKSDGKNKAGQKQALNQKKQAQNKRKTSPRRGKLTEPERNLKRSLKQIEQGLRRIQ